MQYSHKRPKGPTIWYFINRISQNRLDYVEELLLQFGDFIKLPSISPAFLINHPEFIQNVLQQNTDVFTKEGPTFKRLEMMLGIGLLTIQGETWKFHRKLVTPTFHPKHVEQYVPIITQYTHDMLKRWEIFAIQQQPFDIAHEMMLLVLRISGKVLFDVDLIDVASEIIEHIHYGNVFASSVFFFAPWLPTPGNIKFRWTKYKLDTLLTQMICQQYQHHQPNLLTKLTEAKYPHNNQPFSQRELLDEIKTLLVTGHETTGCGLSWLWYLLEKNPSVYHKLIEEIDQTINHVPTIQDFKKLTYTRMVVDETLRLYPPIWMIPRTCQNLHLENGFKIPKRSVIFICPYTLHRHPAYWPNPHSFIPERFDDKHKQERVRYTYLPFGLGPRSCIAGSFALMKMPLIVAQILKNYHVKILSTHAVIADPLVSLRPKHGIWATISKRNV